MVRWFRWFAASTALAFLAACGGGDDDEVRSRNIVEVAQADAQFSILVEAVTAAELGGVLSGPGPFTVFAPTNAAFEKLLTEFGISKAALLADKALLTRVLTYHVLPAEVVAADVPLGRAITTQQGAIFKIEATGGALVVTDGRNRTANITATDVAASNGVVHVIDTVLLPPDKTVVATAISANPEFTTLVAAVEAAGLVGTLNGDGPFTVFAPTNAAFEKLLDELNLTQEQLLADTELLTQVLTYHVVPARVLKAEVPIDTDIATVQGQSFQVDASLSITDARGRSAAITATDVLASNGVIHVIDTVILPAE